MAEEEDIYASLRKEFDRKYNDTIIPLVHDYEGSRKKRLYLAIISSAATAILGVSLWSFSPDLSGLLIASSAAIWIYIQKSFENKIKEKIMPTACSCFVDMKWQEGSYTDSSIFTSSYLISNYSYDDYDDIFYGSYHDVKFEIIESKFTTHSGKHSITIFDGVIVKLEMNKHFTSHTVIKPDMFLNIPPSFKLHHTELEDPEFNKKFDVYTNDEVEARYLITPSFMERLKNMETAFMARTATCVFYNNFLMIALPTGSDLFSLCSLFKPVDDPKQFFRMYDEIESIIKLIDYFKLNQKIGL